jgi:hypothetical protein
LRALFLRKYVGHGGSLTGFWEIVSRTVGRETRFGARESAWGRHTLAKAEGSPPSAILLRRTGMRKPTQSHPKPT